MTYLEQMLLAESGEFQGRVRQALVTVALGIFAAKPKAEPLDPIKYAARQTARQTQAKAILSNPASYQRNFSAVIVATEGFPSDADDAAITQRVKAVWNFVAGLEDDAE